MIVRCPACEQAYDMSLFPVTAQFSCIRCEQAIKAAEATDNSDLLPAPPIVEEDTAAASEVAVETPEEPAEANATGSPYDIEDDLHGSHVEHTVRLRPPQQPEKDNAAQGEDPPVDAPDASEEPMDAHVESDEINATRADLSASVTLGEDAEQHTEEQPEDEPPIERTSIASQAELLASATAMEAEGMTQDFLPAANVPHIDEVKPDENSVQHTLASDADQYDAEALIAQGEKLHEDEQQDSTSVGLNPLLDAQQFIDDIANLNDIDPLGQEESTAVSRNPLLTDAGQPGLDWAGPSVKMPPPSQANVGYEAQSTQQQPAPIDQGYHGASDVDESAQTAFEVPRSMVEQMVQANLAAQAAGMQHSNATPGQATGYAANTAPVPQQAPMPAAQQQAFAQPSSWDSLNAASTDDDEFLVPQVDGRAIAGTALLIVFVMGPICLLLGWSAFQRIRQQDSVFRGKALAVLAMLGGALQTFALGTLLVLFLMFPHNHPALVFVVKTLKSFRTAPPRPDFSKLPPHPAKLDKKRARDILLGRLHHREDKTKLAHLFVHQEPKQRFAFVQWRHPQLKRNQQSLFLYSNRNHWHLARFATQRRYESRCGFETNEAKLKASTARNLLKAFWKIRGRFTGVRVAQLYVVQRPKSHTAHAYWILTKQMPNTPIKQWKVKSLFHRANDGKWHLSRYGIRIPKDELFNQEKLAGPSLSIELAKSLLTEHFKDKQKTFTPSSSYVYQVKGARSAHLLWQSGRQLHRSLFRYTNEDKWLLARIHEPPTHQLAYHEQGTSLGIPTAKKLVTRYMRRHVRKLLLKTFKEQGHKGKPPRRLPQLKHVYIYQPSPQRAFVRWQAAFFKNATFVQSEFHRAASGHWYLSQFQMKQALDSRFGQKAAAPMTVAVAKDLIQQYWQNDVRSEKFNGARIQALYLYKDDTPKLLWAHWRKEQAGQMTSMRTKFVQSNQGRWYMGQYDVGLGFSLAQSTAGSAALAAPTAKILLLQYLKGKKRYQRASISDVYVYQRPTKSVAYVGWRLEEKLRRNKVTKLNSLFHRSTDGRWYLSIFTTPKITP